MAEPAYTEIDVVRLMEAIRKAVSQRSENRETSLLKSSAALRKVISDCETSFTEALDLTFIEGERQFIPNQNDRYHLNELLQYHDKDFVRTAYRAVLKREPDDSGYRHYLEGLRSGKLSRQDILVVLRASSEGKEKAVMIEGLRPSVLRWHLYRIPGLRYTVQLLMGLIRFPIMMRHQAESHNLLLRTVEIIESQRHAARLQHQQIGSLFREQTELAEQQKTLRADMFALPSIEQVRRIVDEAPLSTVSSHSEVSSDDIPLEDRQRIEDFYAAFEDQFRGSRDEVKEGLKIYLPYLKNAGIVNGILDLGSGRGDWLQLLREHDIDGQGVELNNVLVRECRNLGFEVIHADALDHLRSLPDASVRAVTGFHIVEHLPFEKLILLVQQILRVLKPGGLVILESPSPENLVVAACNFYADPTHNKPVYPHTLKFLLTNTGFSDVGLEFLHPASDSPYRDGEGVSQALHMWFYGPRDFAVIGFKA